jgi:DNA-binding FadR family transcriptional regulator
MQAAADDQALYALEVRFWDRVLDGANNVVYRLAFNSMVRAASAMGAEAQRWSVQEVKNAEYRVPVALAMAAGDIETAEAKIRATMQAGLASFAAVLPDAPRMTAQPRPEAATKTRAHAQKRPLAR